MKSRDRLVLGIVALAGVMAALWFVVLTPKREEAAGLADKVTAAEDRRDAAKAKATSAEQARTTYSRDYATVARLGKATPPQADVPSLVYQLETAARDAKVDFRAVSVAEQPVAAAEPTPPPPTDDKAAGKDASAASEPTTPETGTSAAADSAAGITPVTFTLIFEGSFLKVHDLLRLVDRFSRLKGATVKVSGRLLTLDAVNLSAAPAGFPDVKAEITARAYVAPIPDQLPDSGAPATASSPTPTTATQVTK